MKASVQYNDYTGTAAADVSNHLVLKEFLTLKKVDTNRYHPIGASFYHAYAEYFNMSILCIDKDRSEDGKPYVVKLHFSEEISHSQFFQMFKRFEVVVLSRFSDYSDKDVDSELIVSESGIE